MGSEGRIGVLTEAIVRDPAAATREFPRGVFPQLGCGRNGGAHRGAAGQIAAVDDAPVQPDRNADHAETGGHANLIGLLESYLAMRGSSEGKCLLLFGVTGSKAICAQARSSALQLMRKHGGRPCRHLHGQ